MYMRIYGVNSNVLSFKGQRQDRKAVAQLKEDNSYDLNIPNQRRINKALENLSTVPGEDNLRFLLDVSDNLKYGTNIDLNKSAYNDWHKKLLNTAEKSLRISDASVQSKYLPILKRLHESPRILTDVEKEILNQKDLILSSVNKKDLQNIKNRNIRNLENNLDYFIISSEVPTSQKLYILKRLSYFMSDDYEINGQLKDKKTQALAEIVNDIVVDTPESKIPNIKAINQGHHGICAAISICRKNLAYEDKANYVDMILSELDNNDYMMIYDINKLGSHTKIPMEKTYIDFNYALSRGYRIIDTSAMYWMHIADHAGATNERVGHYSAFDKKNFDTFDDIHISADIDNESAVVMQDYYRSLLKAKNELASCKKSLIEKQYNRLIRTQELKNNYSILSKDYQYYFSLISKIAPDLSQAQIRNTANTLLTLQVENSRKASQINDYRRDYIYIEKESDSQKAEKIKGFLEVILDDKLDKEVLSKKINEIVDITNNLHALNSGRSSSYQGRILSEARMLYNAAAAYRTQADFELDVPEYLYSKMLALNIPDNETTLVQNMEKLISKAKAGKLNPALRSMLAVNFNVEDTNEEVLAALEENLSTVKLVITGCFDDIYSACAVGDRKNALAIKIANTKKEIEICEDKNLISQVAEEFGVKPDKYAILDLLNNYQKQIEDKNCTHEQYTDIYNKMGFKSQITDLKNVVENISNLIFAQSEEGEQLRLIFNQMHGLGKNAPIEETAEVYNKIAKNFNDISQLLTAMHQALHIEDEYGNVLNTTDAKSIILKKMENESEIPSIRELAALRERFNKTDELKISSPEGAILYKDMPKEYTTLSPLEKEALQKYKKHINGWYSKVIRDLSDAYESLEEPLSEMHRVNGVRTGRNFLYDSNQGLNSRQEIRIIEHMTDRPYYADTNINRAVQKIKTTPYSGISSTHVSSDSFSAHAQYIADIVPLAMKDKNGNMVMQDTIFHDNTWGAIERDNNWTDVNGNIRTDYDGNYGVGGKGFITNDKFFDGEYVKELKDAVGEVVPKNIPLKAYKKFDDYGDEVIKYQLFSDIITSGTDPSVNGAIRTIRENLLYSPYRYLDDLEKLAQGMTRDEIKREIFSAHNAGLSTFDIYNKVENLVKGDGVLNKGINSIEEYNALPDDSLVKIQFEKAAALLSYDNMPADGKMLYKEFDVSNLKYLKKEILKEARKDFDYTFAKDIKFAVYASESERSKIYDLVEVMAKDNNITIPKNTVTKAVNAMKKPSKDDFDGSLEHMIDLMVSGFKSYLSDNIDDFEGKDKYLDSIGLILTKDLKNNTLMTVEDLHKNFNSPHLVNIANWIDDVFSPATDEEFVDIFNRLRNMTREEFETKYASLINDKSLGLKNISGYDVLKDFKNENESVQNVVFNTIYYQQYAKDVEQSKLRAYYDYDKFDRTSRGAVYVGDRTFNDIYSDYYYSLLMLTRMNNRSKLSKEFFRRYNIFQGYPKVEISDENAIENSMSSLKNNIDDYITYIGAYKVQKASIDLCESLRNKIERYAQKSDMLNAKQRSLLLKDIEALLYINADDETMADLVQKMDDVLITKPMTVEFYDNFIKELYDRFIIYSRTVDGSTMEEAIATNLKNINYYKKTFINGVFPQKYQSKAAEYLNSWINAKIKSSMEPANQYRAAQAEQAFDRFKDFYMKHRIFVKPEEVLNEFLLLSAKDSDPAYTMSKDTPQKVIALARDNRKNSINIHKTNLKGLLYKASLLDLQTTLMNCARKSNLNSVGQGFINSKIKLKDGSYLVINSEEGLSTIINPLLMEKSLDTAAIFFNQLGLAERITELTTGEYIFDKAYKNINRINNILQSIDSQAKFVYENLEELKDIDAAPDYEAKILELKNKILQKTKSTNYRKAGEIYSAAIDDTLSEIANQPDGSKFLILQTNMQQAIDGVKTVVSADIEIHNEEIRAIQNTAKLLSKLELPEHSEASKLRDKFYDEIAKLIEYQNNQKEEYEYIGLCRTAE